ncbi:MAG: hypothetical protein ACLFVS_03210 [Candidatus Acetothermia bacterium]
MLESAHCTHLRAIRSEAQAHRLTSTITTGEFSPVESTLQRLPGGRAKRGADHKALGCGLRRGRGRAERTDTATLSAEQADAHKTADLEVNRQGERKSPALK